VLAWMVLSAFASPRLLSESSDAFKARLFIRNARVQFGRYPLRHIPRIQQIPGVAGMTWLNIVSYDCENATGKRLTISGEGGDIATIFRKREVSETDLEAWQNTENGVLVGSEAARRCASTTYLATDRRDRSSQLAGNATHAVIRARSSLLR